MVFVLATLWLVQERWNLPASSINVIYESPYLYHILADDRILTDSGFVPLLGDSIDVRRVVISGDSIFFLTSSMEKPVMLYSLRGSTSVHLPVRGAFADYDPNSGILISPISLMGSHSYLLRDSLSPIDIYGVRVLTFSDSLLYVDRYGNLRLASGRVLMGGVRDVLAMEGALLVLTSGSVLLMDENFRVVHSMPRDFQLASAFYWDGSNGYFLLSSGKEVFLWKPATGLLQSLFQAEDSVICMSPVDYDENGVMDILISTSAGLYLYSSSVAASGPPADRVMVRGYGYPSTCGGMYGMKFVPGKRDSRLVKLETRYIPDGWIVSFRAPGGERARIRVVNSRGITVFHREFTTVRGRNTMEIRDGFQTGTYTITVEGETFRGRRMVIWKGR